MAAPGVYQNEKDLSDRVESQDGVYAFIQIRAKRGPTEPRWITSETELLNRYTPEGRVEVGYDLAYYSAIQFLSASNTLLVQRVVPADAGLSGALLTDSAVGDIATRDIEEDFAFGAGEVAFFTSADPGAWGNKIGVKVLTYDTYPRAVKEPNAFIVQVYLQGTTSPVEEFVCSLSETHLDGNQRNIYMEEVLKRSSYIRGYVNPAVDPETTTYPAELTDVTYLASGTDGSAVTAGEMILGVENVKNPDSYPMTLLLDGGFTIPSYQQSLVAAAESRGDCVALLSMPIETQETESYVEDMIAYREGTFQVASQSFLVDSSYAALYGPHIEAYDKFNDRLFYASPEGYVASIISKTSISDELWVPPAGFRRGNIVAQGVRRQFNREQLGLLYDVGINSFRYATGRGINLWGQKTLQARASATDRLNVRLLLITIKPAIAKMLDEFVFEFNDDRTRSLIYSKITSYMEGIKARLGVYDYTVKCDAENNTSEDIDSNQLNCWLYVQPRKSAETINFTTIITRTGATVETA